MSAHAAAAQETGWLEDVEREFEESVATVTPPGQVQEDGHEAGGGPPDICATPRTIGGEVRHPEIPGQEPDLDLPQLKPFSLRGMLMHVMLSYRVASEGVGKTGNGFVKDLYSEILRLSTSDTDLTLPSTGLGKFPHFLKRPRSSRTENQV